MAKNAEQNEKTKQPRRFKIVIDRELCKGCQLCISVCPKNQIAVSQRLNQRGYYPAELTGNENQDRKDKKCTGCALCATICPDVAIEVYSE